MGDRFVGGYPFSQGRCSYLSKQAGSSFPTAQTAEGVRCHEQWEPFQSLHSFTVLNRAVAIAVVTIAARPTRAFFAYGSTCARTSTFPVCVLVSPSSHVFSFLEFVSLSATSCLDRRNNFKKRRFQSINTCAQSRGGSARSEQWRGDART